jgi:hypothetical protein
MKPFCQLLVAPTGQACLPIPGWDTGLLAECTNPAIN